MNKYIKPVIAGTLATGIVYLLFFLRPAGITKYQVHYIVGADKSNGRSGKEDYARLGEAPVLMKKRISEIGYYSVIKITNDNLIDIRIRDVKDTSVLPDIILKKTGTEIGFRPVYTLDQLPSFFPAADRVATQLLKSQGIYTILSPSISREINGRNYYPANIGFVSRSDTTALNRILRDRGLRRNIPDGLEFYYGDIIDENVKRNNPEDLYLYAVHRKTDFPEIHNDDIAAIDIPDYSDQVNIQFNNSGTRKWKTITGAYTGDHIAVILADMVSSSLEIPFTGSDGHIAFNTGIDPAQLKDLASRIKSGGDGGGWAILSSDIQSPEETLQLNGALLLPLVFLLVSVLAFIILKRLKARQE